MNEREPGSDWQLPVGRALNVTSTATSSSGSFGGSSNAGRRIATRYEKKAQNFASFVWLAAGLTAVT